MKWMFTGGATTPFAFGVYVFDVFVPDSYPSVPPRVHFFKTPKGSEVRYSPSL